MSKTISRVIVRTVEETCEFALKEVAPVLKEGDVLILDGGLGAGKTTFVKCIVEYYGISGNIVSSPTFTIMNVYRGEKVKLFHVDLYRIEHNDDIFFDELFETSSNCIFLVEWGKRFVTDIVKMVEGRIFILNIRIIGDQKRELIFETYSDN